MSDSRDLLLQKYSHFKEHSREPSVELKGKVLMEELQALGSWEFFLSCGVRIFLTVLKS